MYKLFSGTAHEELSKSVSERVRMPLSKAEVIRFGNSEVKVTIQENVKGHNCIVIQPTINPTDQHVMELLFYCDALKRSEANRVIAIIPYFGYAKQNLQHRPGEFVSANVVIRMLEAVGFDKVVTYDIHDEATGGVFMIPFKNSTLFPTLAAHVREALIQEGTDIQQIALVSPDQGAVEKVRGFGKSFFKTDDFHEVVIEKNRDQHTAHRAKPVDIYGVVDNKTVVIVDDMIVSGSTLLPAVDLCLKRGATQVYAAIVHNDFTHSAPDLIQGSKLKKLFTTNTIPFKNTEKFDKIKQIDISDVIAEEIQSIIH